MTLVNRLSKYYKYCLYEEAKISAFSNLHKGDNIVIKLNGYEKVFHNFPTPYVSQEESIALTQIMLKQQVNNKKQLIYGYIFITGQLEDGTEIYTPLIYADCNLERINGRVAVSVNEDTISFNLPALVQLVNTNEERDMLIQNILKHDIINMLPLKEEDVKAIEATLGDIIPALDTKGKKADLDGNEYKVHLNRENAVILTTINKGLAGVINDLDLISQAPLSITDKSSLKAITADDEPEINSALDEVYPSQFPYSEEDNTLKNFFPAFNLDKSQEKVARVAACDTITAITGGPGTGKSNTISAIATNYILNGKTVLICSKMNSAVDVVYNKLSLLSRLPYAVRTGGKEYRKSLSELLDKIITNKYDLSEKDVEQKQKSLELLLSKVQKNDEYETALELYNSLTTEHSQALEEWENEDNIIRKFFKKRKMQELNKLSHIAFSEYEECRAQFTGDNNMLKLKKDVLSVLVRGNIAEVTTDNMLRRRLTLFAKALGKGELGKYDYYSTFQELVHRVLPCWCTTAVDVSSSIPAIAGLFDVVIIDEASQCDIATCLPLLYRAKRAVIVGDDKQLKYLSFLTTATNNANIESNNLGKYAYICNYRENSMFDFANYFSNGNVMLKTQYRGCTAIMQFSNEKFYNNNLTNVGKSYYSNPVILNKVAGSVAADKSVNHAEAKEIIEAIKDIIKDDKIEGKLLPTTIGVLSPFREQCKHLEKLITNVFTMEEIEKHKIVVGTAHSFQGEERDVMLVSWTVADNSPFQSFTFINNPNLFNVSITRANKQIRNYISATNLPKGLLKEYVEYCEKINISSDEVEQTPAEVA